MNKHSTTHGHESIKSVQSQRSDLYRERVEANKRRKSAESRVREARRELRNVSRQIAEAERAERTSRLTGTGQSDVAELKAHRRKIASRIGGYSRSAKNSQTKVDSANAERDTLASRIESIRGEWSERREQSRQAKAQRDVSGTGEQRDGDRKLTPAERINAAQGERPKEQPSPVDSERPAQRKMREAKERAREPREQGLSPAERIRQANADKPGAPVPSTGMDTKYPTTDKTYDHSVTRAAQILYRYIPKGQEHNEARSDAAVQFIAGTLDNVESAGIRWKTPKGHKISYSAAIIAAYDGVQGDEDDQVDKDDDKDDVSKWSVEEIMDDLKDELEGSYGTFPYKGIAGVN